MSTEGGRDMNKTQASYLFVAALSLLAVPAMLFFAATDSKNAVVFYICAVFIAFTGAVRVYQFMKRRPRSMEAPPRLARTRGQPKEAREE